MGKKFDGRSMCVEGYFTVEATLIMPIVLYVCVFIIYTGFYWYDRCLMKQDAYRAALAGSSIYRDDNQKVYNTVADTIARLAEDKYIATDYTIVITVQSKVNVTISGQIAMPFRGLAKLLGKEKWEILENAESKCINPVVFIRMCRMLEDF